MSHFSAAAVTRSQSKQSETAFGKLKAPDRIINEDKKALKHAQSCDICQRTIRKGRVIKIPLGKLPLIDTPFKGVSVRLVGPNEPRSDRKSR